jgi:hypothetical protein
MRTHLHLSRRRLRSNDSPAHFAGPKEAPQGNSDGCTRKERTKLATADGAVQRAGATPLGGQALPLEQSGLFGKQRRDDFKRPETFPDDPFPRKWGSKGTLWATGGWFTSRGTSTATLQLPRRREGPVQSLRRSARVQVMRMRIDQEERGIRTRNLSDTEMQPNIPSTG